MARKNKKVITQIDFNQLNNASRTLLANIRFAGVDKPIKTIAITSSGVDEGKSTTAVSLAMSMAQSGKRTLIIDADMRRRSLAKVLNLRSNVGFYSVLTGSASMRDAIQRVPDHPNLYFLDCEANVPNPPDILSSKRFETLLDKLAQSVDYIVVDTPPLGLFVDAAIISTLVDGVALCVRENVSKKKAVADALEQLGTANANVLGFIVTFSEKRKDDYYYYYAYYNEDNERVKKKHTHSSNATLDKNFDKSISDAPAADPYAPGAFRK